VTLALPDAYPLAWPDGWPRKPDHVRRNATYQVAFARARDDLLAELRLAGARHVVISSNIALRRDGLPYANLPEPRDPGVAVYWDDRKGNPRVMACDVWRSTRENLRAIGLAVSSLRQIERTGATDLLERAFEGFKRLPASRSCWDVLGISGPGAGVERITARFRELARQHHPDKGGDPRLMAEISAAYQEALRLEEGAA
jgi:hypothetical protein